MADSQTCDRILNPWVLHLQKLGLELKCPSCLELFNKPNLLPCDHLFCGSCLPDPNSSSGSACAICKRPFHMKDVRQASFIESIANIYRSLDQTFTSCMQQAAYAKGSLTPLPSSKTKLRKDGQDEVIDLNENQPNQLSQGSPPFGPGSSDDSLERDTVKKSNKRLADEFTLDEVHCSTNPLPDNSEKTIKKPKQNTNSKGGVHNIVDSDAQLINPSTSLDGPLFVCGFCHTSKVTEYTGPMMHYAADGKPVVGQKANKPDVMHVHSRCTEWTPQVYYLDETVMNLNKELQRGAKLKCFKCNLKGAALGCYAKSCKRTYHAPCAAEISNCRWDMDQYLLLCPIHASFKFPSEKSKKHGSVKPTSDIPTQKEMDYISFWSVAHTGAKNWVFCPSSLSDYEKVLVTELASICGATVSKSYTPTVTHVIAGIDEAGAYTRTRKALMAILEGKWVLSIDWIEECLKMRFPVDEEPYEINLDNHGCRDGPRTGRMRADGIDTKLFNGLNFYFTGESTFVGAHLEDVKYLIRAAGGNLLESKSMVQESSMIVYNCDSDTDSESDSGALQSQLEAEVLAAETGALAIPHTRILDAIASCNLMPLLEYKLGNQVYV